MSIDQTEHPDHAEPPGPPIGPVGPTQHTGAVHPQAVGSSGAAGPPTGGAAPPAPPHPWRTRLTNPFVVMPIVTVLAVGGWWLLTRPSGKPAATATPVTAQLVAVSTGPLSQTVSAQGTVAAAATDSLNFASSGTVTAVNVKAGDTVTAGQVLATIDSAALQAAVTKAEAQVASATATLADDRAAGASSAQLTADTTNLASANDALAGARSALAGASLVATINGEVTAVNLTVGEQLGSGGSGGTSTSGTASGSGGSSSNLGSAATGAGGGANGANGSGASSTSASPQISVVSAGSYVVKLAVNSADIGSVANGQTANLTLTSATSSANGGRQFGFGRAAQAAGGATGATGATGPTGAGGGAGVTGATASGTVTDVGKVADASTGVATFPVTVSFTAPPNTFFVGSTVTASIVTKNLDNVLQVPAQAITTATDGTTTVEVSTDGTTTSTRSRTITTGLTSAGMVQVISGLSAGDQVVVTRGGFGGGFNPAAAGANGARTRTTTAGAGQ